MSDDVYDAIMSLMRPYFKDDLDDGSGAWHFPPNSEWPNGLVTDSQEQAFLEYVKRAAALRAPGDGWVSADACVERVRAAYREGAYYGWTHGYSLEGCIQDARERSLIRYPLPAPPKEVQP